MEGRFDRQPFETAPIHTRLVNSYPEALNIGRCIRGDWLNLKSRRTDD